MAPKIGSKKYTFHFTQISEDLANCVKQIVLTEKVNPDKEQPDSRWGGEGEAVVVRECPPPPPL